MGKKRRMRSYPQKFGRKFASHPYARAQAKLREIKEEAMADGVITAEEKLKIAAAEAEVESLTPVLDAVTEELVPEPVVEEVAPEPAVEEPVVEEEAPEPIVEPPVAEVPVVTEKPKRRKPRRTAVKKSTTRKRTTKKKVENKE